MGNYDAWRDIIRKQYFRYGDEFTMPKCNECENNFGFLELKNGVCKSCINKNTPPCNGCGKNFEKSDLSDGYCLSCKEKSTRAEKVNQLNSSNEAELKSIVLTTETSPNIEIVERLEIISAECVYGMNIFRDLFANVRDIVGGKSKASQRVLKDARKEVLKELREEAFIVGANAVVGVDLDYGEFSGGGKSMLLVVATGTAVKTKT
jgi:uncharacterized protein YbjQ (UPF0145 family)